MQNQEKIKLKYVGNEPVFFPGRGMKEFVNGTEIELKAEKARGLLKLKRGKTPLFQEIK